MEPWQLDREFANSYKGDIRYWAWQWMYSRAAKGEQDPAKQQPTLDKGIPVQQEAVEDWQTSFYLLPKPKSNPKTNR